MNSPASKTDVAGLPILMYHSIDPSGSVVSVAPDLFEKQMDCLADTGFRGISLSEAVSYRQSTGQWPARAAALTFDDGYASFCESAFPALARCGFTATVFIVSDHTGGHNDWEEPPAGLGLRPLLSWQQARELSESGIEIGAHSRTHPDLRRIPAARVEDEIINSRVEIEDRIQKPVRSFAYPFGYTSPTAIEIVKRTFQSACSTSLQRARTEPLHQLSRVDMYYIKTIDSFRRLISGQLDGYLAARRWMRRVRSLMFSN
jgi:peptidoglycan/xylan/chitin deacetylase (PgdA/CDA1 family)